MRPSAPVSLSAPVTRLHTGLHTTRTSARIAGFTSLSGRATCMQHASDLHATCVQLAQPPQKPDETTCCARRLVDRKHTLGACSRVRGRIAQGCTQIPPVPEPPPAARGELAVIQPGQALTGFYKLLQVRALTGSYRLLQALTSSYKCGLLQALTGSYRLLQALT